MGILRFCKLGIGQAWRSFFLVGCLQGMCMKIKEGMIFSKEELEYGFFLSNKILRIVGVVVEWGWVGVDEFYQVYVGYTVFILIGLQSDILLNIRGYIVLGKC